MKDKNNQEIEKEKNERTILNRLYNHNLYIIEKTEEPDFILTNKETNEIFGVEITELFINESSARIKKKPDYMQRIIGGIDNNRYLDKNDIKELPAVKIYAKNINNEYEEMIDAVQMPRLTVEGYIDKIKKIVETKNKKNYRDKYQKVELFIYDTEDYFYSKDKNTMYKLLNNKDLLDLVKNSIFSGVYIFTKYNREDVTIAIREKEDSKEYEILLNKAEKKD